MTKPTLLLSLVVLAAACGAAPAPVPLVQQENVAADRDALLAADRAHAQATLMRGYALGFAEFLADDVTFLARRAPILSGKDVVIAFLQGQNSVLPTTLSWEPAWAHVAADHSMGYTYGWATLKTTDDAGKETTAYAHYLSYWRKDGGAWRVVANLRNASPDAAEPVPPAWQDTTPDMAAVKDVDAERDGLLLADAEFSDRSVAEGVDQAFPAFAALHGVSLSNNGHVLFGREAIRADFASPPAGFVLSWAPVLGDVATTGDLGYTIGNAVSQSIGVDGKQTTSYSKYLTVWQKEDSEWKFVVDGGNSRPAP